MKNRNIEILFCLRKLWAFFDEIDTLQRHTFNENDCSSLWKRYRIIKDEVAKEYRCFYLWSRILGWAETYFEWGI